MLQVSARKSLGQFQLDLNFTAPGKGVTAVFGPSGSGKTSLVRLLAGLSDPDEGEIALGEKVYFSSKRALRLAPQERRVGYVVQDALLFPHLSVAKNLVYGAKRIRPDFDLDYKQRELVTLLGLTGILERSPAKLSGGERQRVAIARALLSDPDLVLMDEPISALDLARRREVLTYLDCLRDPAAPPMLYVTHALNEMARLADYLILIEEGKVVAADHVEVVTASERFRRLVPPEERCTVIKAKVIDHDLSSGLAELDCLGGRLLVPSMEHLYPGDPFRIMLRDREVALATEKPTGLSIQNAFPAVVTNLTRISPGEIDVELKAGDSTFHAAVTPRAAVSLRLEPGRQVHALVKSVSLDR